jgi:hypothetical protein
MQNLRTKEMKVCLGACGFCFCLLLSAYCFVPFEVPQIQKARPALPLPTVGLTPNISPAGE